MLPWALAMPSSADQVKADDVILQGNLCVGQDCVNGEDFALGELKLKENNTRIRWQDTSAVAGSLVRQQLPNSYVEGNVGESWRLDANESTNGGKDAFYINQQSLDTYIVLSDGTSPDYDCSDPFVSPKPVVGTIAEGNPVENESNCGQVERSVQIDGLVLEDSAIGGVALGVGATLEVGEVSLGNAELRRRLVHVANALADSDVLIKSQLDIGIFQEESQRLNDIEAMLTMAESEIAVLENATTLSFGGGGAVGWGVTLLGLVVGVSRRRHRRTSGPQL